MAPRPELRVARPSKTPTVTRITPETVLTGRSFQVLQPHRASAQLPLFPPPGSTRTAR